LHGEKEKIDERVLRNAIQTKKIQMRFDAVSAEILQHPESIPTHVMNHACQIMG